MRRERLQPRMWMLGLALASALGCVHPTAPTAPPAWTPSQEGLASYYSMALAGRRTASGEPYDPEALTAAHRSLPFGAIVRVERIDAKNDAATESVEVRVNDRGPYVGGRIIDLSDAAARRLGMKRDGVVPVRLEIVALP